MQVLAVIRYEEGVSRDDIVDLIVPEERASWRAYLDGFIREIFIAGNEAGTEGRTAVIVILETEGVDEARERMGEFPMVREGYVHVEYIELEPFSYWEQLFKPEERTRHDPDDNH